jgi:hypothetical protein
VDNSEYRKQNPPSVNHATYNQIPVIINQYDLLSKRENYELMAHESMGTHEPKVKNGSRDKVQRAKTNTWRRNIKL